MLAVAFWFAVAQGANVPARASRSAFAHALSTCKVDMSAAEVRKLLGPPDDIWPVNDSRFYNPGMTDERWCYGTNGHHTMPTLGAVFIRDGKLADSWGRGESPSASVITEAELVEGMRKLYVSPELFPPSHSPWYSSDPRLLIRAANVLIEMGHDKALAVLREFYRVGKYGPDPFWLVRVAFDSTLKDGCYVIPAIGRISPEPNEARTKWPTYPIVMAHELPLSLVRGVTLRGYPEQFIYYIVRTRNNLKLRSRPITPPSDPFTRFETLVKSEEWPLGPYAKDRPLDFIGYSDDAGPALQQILTMLRYVCPTDAREFQPIDNRGWDFKKLHHEFVANGGHWDVRLQEYVRGDGTTLAKPETWHLQHRSHFDLVPSREVNVTIWRETSTELGGRFQLSENTARTVKNPAVVIEDAVTGKMLYWLDPRYLQKSNSDEIGYQTSKASLDAYLREPRQPAVANDDQYPKGLPLPTGRSIRVVVLYDGHRFSDAAFTP